MGSLNRLSVTKVRKQSKSGAFADGNGLYLQVRRSGETIFKSWIFRYMRHGKARTMGLGSVRIVSLAEARLSAATLQKQIFSGTDPLHAKRSSQRTKVAPIFRDVASQYVDIHRTTWKNAKHGDQWSNTLRDYAHPVVGDLPVDQIFRDHIVRILEPIWVTKRETATRVRGRIEKILDFATVEGLRSGENPARWRGNLEHSLAKRSQVQQVTHHKALPWREVPAFYNTLTRQHGVAALALRFTILTASRTSEVRFATHQEFNREDDLWVVPKERMKAGREHRVPLSQPVRNLLEDINTGSTYLFSLLNDKALSENGMLSVLKRMDMSGITVHGFRSSFRDWSAEQTDTPREVIELCLAHANRNQVEAAYLRTDMIDMRREVMDRWSGFVLSQSPQRTTI